MAGLLNRRQLLAGSAAPALAQTAPSSPRSVLLLVSDDQSMIAGCYGNPVVRTPNLDRLAARGVRFTHSFCTTASCSASRSVILTGLQNHANGQFGHAHDFHNFHTHEWVHSIPRLAKARGAVTGVVGKLHVNPPLVYPWDFEPKVNQRDVWSMAQQAAAFFKTAGGRPFYLHVGYSDPHRAGRGFGNEKPFPNVRPHKYAPGDVTVPSFLPDRPEVRQELAEYYQAIDRLDQGIGFMLEELEKSGRAKDTLVMFLSDNGMPFPGAKASFYDSGMRVPLIVHRPGMGAGAVNQALVHWPDIAPTVADWMGLKPPAYGFQGRSLLPVLEQSSPAGWDEIFFSHTFHEINNYYPNRGIRTRRHKYVKFLFPELEMPLPSDLFASPTWQVSRKLERMGVRRTQAVMRHAAEELYDLEKDPNETTSIAAQQPGLLADLRAKVLRFRRETKDPWLIVDEQRGEAS